MPSKLTIDSRHTIKLGVAVKIALVCLFESIKGNCQIALIKIGLLHRFRASESWRVGLQNSPKVGLRFRDIQHRSLLQ